MPPAALETRHDLSTEQLSRALAHETPLTFASRAPTRAPVDDETTARVVVAVRALRASVVARRPERETNVLALHGVHVDASTYVPKDFTSAFRTSQKQSHRLAIDASLPWRSLSTRARASVGDDPRESELECDCERALDAQSACYVALSTSSKTNSSELEFGSSFDAHGMEFKMANVSRWDGEKRRAKRLKAAASVGTTSRALDRSSARECERGERESPRGSDAGETSTSDRGLGERASGERTRATKLTYAYDFEENAAKATFTTRSRRRENDKEREKDERAVGDGVLAGKSSREMERGKRSTAAALARRRRQISRALASVDFHCRATSDIIHAHDARLRWRARFGKMMVEATTRAKCARGAASAAVDVELKRDFTFSTRARADTSARPRIFSITTATSFPSRALMVKITRDVESSSFAAASSSKETVVEARVRARACDVRFGAKIIGFPNLHATCSAFLAFAFAFDS